MTNFSAFLSIFPLFALLHWDLFSVPASLSWFVLTAAVWFHLGRLSICLSLMPIRSYSQALQHLLHPYTLLSLCFYILFPFFCHTVKICCASLSTESPGKQLLGLQTSPEYIFDHSGYMWSYMSLQIRLMPQFPVLIFDHAHSVDISVFFCKYKSWLC